MPKALQPNVKVFVVVVVQQILTFYEIALFEFVKLRLFLHIFRHMFV